MTRADSELLAFEVEVDDIRAIVFARTEKSARMSAVLSYREAGFCQKGEWPPGVRSRREPRFDRSPDRFDQPGKCWREDCLRAY